MLSSSWGPPWHRSRWRSPTPASYKLDSFMWWDACRILPTRPLHHQTYQLPSAPWRNVGGRGSRPHRSTSQPGPGIEATHRDQLTYRVHPWHPPWRRVLQHRQRSIHVASCCDWCTQPVSPATPYYPLVRRTAWPYRSSDLGRSY